MEYSKQIKVGAILSYFSIALNIVSGLIYTPWMISQIGESDYGLYTLANSLITLFLVDFGLSSATSRYISKYRAEGRQDKIDSFLGAIYKLYLLIDAIIFVVLFVVFFFLSDIYVSLTFEELERFKIVYVIVATFAIINFPCITLNGILNAYENFIQLKLADVIYRVLLVAITIVALVLGYGLFALVAIHSIVGLIVVLYKIIVIKKVTPIRINFKENDILLYKDILGFSIWITISSLAQRLVFNITPSILGMLTNSMAIAVFGIVTTIEGYAYTITTAINGMFMTRIARIYETNDSDIMPLFLKVGKFQYALNGLILCGFVTVGKTFIKLWMGNDFLDAYYGILLVIIPGMFFNSLQIANTAMVVKKKVKHQALVSIVTGVVNVVFSVVLTLQFGVLGACMSIFIAYMFRAIAMHIVCWKVLKLNIVEFMKKCYLKMSISILLTICLGIVLNFFWLYESWLVLICKAFLIMIIYAILVFGVGLDKYDRSKIFKIIKKKIPSKEKK